MPADVLGDGPQTGKWTQLPLSAVPEFPPFFLGAVGADTVHWPEPGRAILLGAGLVLLWGLDRRRQ